jgi:hypothetical protein
MTQGSNFNACHVQLSLFSRNFNFNLLQRAACIIIQRADSVVRQENISMSLCDATRQTAPPPPPPIPGTIIHQTKSY